MTTAVKIRVCPYCGKEFTLRSPFAARRICCYDPACEELNRAAKRARELSLHRIYNWKEYYSRRKHQKEKDLRPKRKCVKCGRYHRGYFELCCKCQDEIREEIDVEWLFYGGAWNEPKSVY